MGQKIVVGPINKGLRNDVTPFNIDNDSFPVLINAYQWRGRVKRKRGTTFLNRLQRLLFEIDEPNPDGTATYSNDLLADFKALEPNSAIVPGTLTFYLDKGLGNETIYTDNGSGVVTRVSGPFTISSGSINYSTGVLTLNFTGIPGPGIPAAATFNYFPNLPVMGLEDLIIATHQFPKTIAFDTRYSYNILTNSPYTIYDVSFYKNPAANPTTMPGYIPKTTWTETSWNGQDYQQFYTVNYQGALWATNGITMPFTTTNIGMQFRPITAITIDAAGPPAIATITLNIGVNPLNLVVGDFVFINEVVGITGINWQTGYVIAVPGANQIQVEFPFATLGGAYASGGIAQYLTSRANPLLDGIRWYDGDPVDVNGTFIEGKGWVNFSPPLSQSSFSIADLPLGVYYLVGARMIVPFKDRLLFIGPVVQTSTGTPKYLQDTVIYSLNGTPYYTGSYTNSPSAAVDTPTSITNVYHPLLLPENQTSFPPGWFEDSPGFGGFITAGVDQPINTVESNGDVLIMGFSFQQTKLVYSGNDIVPFNFYLINTELGSSSTFSTIDVGSGVLTRGSRGYINTNQTGATRFDLLIPDEVYQVTLSDNGTERITAQRDYINEWIYFTYPVKSVPDDQGSVDDETYKFPNRTLQYNYRDETWAVFNEAYTHYGIFRKTTGNTWATLPSALTWGSWDEPWNAGSSELLQPNIIAGNQQGFVVIRDQGTNESNSLYIQNISGNVVTSPDHTLNVGDYIVISGALGTVSSFVNGEIFSINSVTKDTFVINPTPTGTGTYLGGGLIKRMYVPYIQTKQFPLAWDMARKTRLGPQQYLLSTTDNGQIQLLIFLSQNADDPYNDGPIIPTANSNNNGLIYSSVLYTCPESANLGLTPANTNLQMISNINPAGTNANSPQAQIWHRVNTSLIGDTVQVGFSMSDEQMRDPDFNNQFEEIEIHSMVLDVQPSSLLA